MPRGRQQPAPLWALLMIFVPLAAFFIGATRARGQKAEAAPKKPAGAAPTVVSKAKRKEQRKVSEFLRPSDSRRYDLLDEEDDDLPWRQASFFGVKAKGQRFVYVVDCSGSMLDEARLVRAKDEVRRSVQKLQQPQQFKVIFYNEAPIPMPGDLPRTADLTAKNQLLAWMNLIEPDGDTDPRGALQLALSLRPDAVFLLSDGEFLNGTADAVAKSNSRKIPIHCIDLGNGVGGDQLKRIAKDSGGRYALRPWTGE